MHLRSTGGGSASDDLLDPRHLVAQQRHTLEHAVVVVRRRRERRVVVQLRVGEIRVGGEANRTTLDLEYPADKSAQAIVRSIARAQKTKAAAPAAK